MIGINGFKEGITLAVKVFGPVKICSGPAVEKRCIILQFPSLFCKLEG
jgi:hypothetical protein